MLPIPFLSFNSESVVKFSHWAIRLLGPLRSHRCCLPMLVETYELFTVTLIGVIASSLLMHHWPILALIYKQTGPLYVRTSRKVPIGIGIYMIK